MANFNKVSGSVLAMTAAGALPASAQDALSGFTLDVKGGYGITSTLLADKVGDSSSDKFGDDDSTGISGSVRMKRAITPVYDYSVGVSGNFLSNSNDKVGDSGTDTFRSEIDDRFTSIALDADIGFNTTVAETPVRIFGGVRALRARSTSEFYLENSTDFFEVDKVGTFQGIGPRVGVEAGKRIGNTDFGWSGSLAGAALFGAIDTSFDVDGSSTTPSEFDTDNDQTVFNLDAALGIDWHISATSKVSAGYQIQKFWNVNDDQLVDDNDKLIHGAFLGYTTSF